MCPFKSGSWEQNASLAPTSISHLKAETDNRGGHKMADEKKSLKMKDINEAL
jgi:hypothetical protein